MVMRIKKNEKLDFDLKDQSSNKHSKILFIDSKSEQSKRPEFRWANTSLSLIT